MGTEFMFIVKTQSSEVLSRSKGARERFLILSHVQTNRRRAESGQQYRAEEPWSQHTTVIAMTEVTENSSDGDTESGRQIDKRRKPARRPKASTKSSPATTGSSIPEPTTQSQQILTIYPIHNTTDPFHCTVVGLDAGSHTLLHQTFYSASRSNFLAESFAPSSVCLRRSSTRHDSMYRQRLSRCVSDPTLMYTTLAYGSSFLGWTTGGIPEEDRPAEYFIGKALKEVRKRLSTRSSTSGTTADNWLALSIYALAVTEMWNGIPTMWKRFPGKYAVVKETYQFGLSACRIHLKALVQVVAEAGGWEMFEPYVLDGAILTDKYFAVCASQPPVIPLGWDPGAVTKAMRAGVGSTLVDALPRLGTELLVVGVRPELYRIISDIVEYSRFAHVAWLRPGVGADIELWLFRRLQALQYHLLLLMSSDEVSTFDQCVCLASLTFLLNCSPHGGPQLGAQYAARRLRFLLTWEAAEMGEPVLTDEVHLWIFCMGAMVAGDFPERSWFMGKILEHYPPWLALTDVDLKAVLEGYLFLPLKQDAQLAGMVDMLLMSS